MKSLLMLSRLLDYPDEILWCSKQDFLSELGSCIELNFSQVESLLAFSESLFNENLLDGQEKYCELFDRGRSASLLLFEHVHGESRDRGQAMIDLLAQYKQIGFELVTKELPDYLPVYLEYLSALPAEQAQQGLQDIAPILSLLGERLRKRESHYAILFDVLVQLSGTQVETETLKQAVSKEGDDFTPEALDAVWEEEQITFLAEQGCPSSTQYMHQKRFANAVVPQYLDIGSLSGDSK